MKSSLLSTGIFSAALFLAAGSVRADTIYTYTGKPFTIVSAPYTTKDFVSAVLTTATPLAPNLPLGNITLDSLTLSDGVQSIQLSLSLPMFTIQAGTDATGAISTWSIFLGYSTSNFIWTQSTTTVVADTGSLDSTRNADNDATPGVWSSSSSAAPEPASVSLLAAGLLALLACALKRPARR